MHQNSSLLELPVTELDHAVDAVGKRWERLRGQRLLLTGGTGFIGKWLLATFLRANRRFNLRARVVLISRQPETFLKSFPQLRETEEIEWITGDVRNCSPQEIGECGFAIHAATDVAATNTPAEILDTCITGTRRVLEAMQSGTAPRRVLLLSSGAVYGRTPPEISSIPEEWMGAPDPLQIVSTYGEGKRVSELLGTIASNSRPNFEVAIARCFAFVGPHLPLDKHFAIGNFIEAAIQGKDIRIQGDGTPLRSYLYAADLAHWLFTILFDAPNGRAYNVGGLQSISISDLAHKVNQVLGGKGQVQIAQKPQPGSFPQSYVPSIKRVADELGLQAHFGLDEAILRTAHWASTLSK